MKIGYIAGVFDLLHIGHIKSFQYAKKYGEKLIVAVNSDESIRRLKGDGRPINSLEERVCTLAYLSMIDMVVPFEEDTVDEHNLYINYVRDYIDAKIKRTEIGGDIETSIKELNSSVIIG